MLNEPIAHITENGRTHTLREHLFETAQRAADFAAVFGIRQWAYLAGLWHDLGKYSRDYQQYIRAVADAHLEGKPGRVNHSSAGALLALERLDRLGRVLAYLIGGHHAGLPDWQNEMSPQASLAYRLTQSDLLEVARAGGVPDPILHHPAPTEKPKTASDLSLSMWLRMLFSCLVDADFLDTEAFMEAETAARGKGIRPWPK